ncbi:hypothetical protein R0K05_23210, partial [Planococcus sp. SIMBA_160]
GGAKTARANLALAAYRAVRKKVLPNTALSDLFGFGVSRALKKARPRTRPQIKLDETQRSRIMRSYRDSNQRLADEYPVFASV